MKASLACRDHCGRLGRGQGKWRWRGGSSREAEPGNDESRGENEGGGGGANAVVWCECVARGQEQTGEDKEISEGGQTERQLDVDVCPGVTAGAQEGKREMGTYRKVNHAKVILLIGRMPQLRQETATQTRATAAGDGLPAAGRKRAGRLDKQASSHALGLPQGERKLGRKSVSMPLLVAGQQHAQHGLGCSRRERRQGKGRTGDDDERVGAGC